MSVQNLQSIFNFTKNYKDPLNKLPLDEKNENMQVVEKDGNVNISLNISKKYLEEYRKLGDLFKESIVNINGILSVNVALTLENQSNSSNKNETSLVLTSRTA